MVCFFAILKALRLPKGSNVLVFYLLVCDDHVFKDQMLFYRFRQDDGSGGFDKDVQLVFQAIDIYNR